MFICYVLHISQIIILYIDLLFDGQSFNICKKLEGQIYFVILQNVLVDSRYKSNKKR